MSGETPLKSDGAVEKYSDEQRGILDQLYRSYQRIGQLERHLEQLRNPAPTARLFRRQARANNAAMIEQELQRAADEARSLYHQALSLAVTEPVSGAFALNGGMSGSNQYAIMKFRRMMESEPMEVSTDTRAASPEDHGEGARDARDQEPTEEDSADTERGTEHIGETNDDIDEREPERTGRESRDSTPVERATRNLREALDSIEDEATREIMHRALTVNTRETQRLDDQYGVGTIGIINEIFGDKWFGRFLHGGLKFSAGAVSATLAGGIAGTPGVLLSPAMAMVGKKAAIEGAAEIIDSFGEIKIDRKISEINTAIKKYSSELREKLTEEPIDIETVKDIAHAIDELEAERLEIYAGRLSRRAKANITEMCMGVGGSIGATFLKGLPTGFQRMGGIKLAGSVISPEGHKTSLNFLKGWMFKYNSADMQSGGALEKARNYAQEHAASGVRLSEQKTGLMGSAGHAVGATSLATKAALLGGLGIASAALFLSARHDKKNVERIKDLSEEYRSRAEAIRANGRTVDPALPRVSEVLNVEPDEPNEEVIDDDSTGDDRTVPAETPHDEDVHVNLDDDHTGAVEDPGRAASDLVIPDLPEDGGHPQEEPVVEETVTDEGTADQGTQRVETVTSSGVAGSGSAGSAEAPATPAAPTAEGFRPIDSRNSSEFLNSIGLYQDESSHGLVSREIVLRDNGGGLWRVGNYDRSGMSGTTDITLQGTDRNNLGITRKIGIRDLNEYNWREDKQPPSLKLKIDGKDRQIQIGEHWKWDDFEGYIHNIELMANGEITIEMINMEGEKVYPTMSVDGWTEEFTEGKMSYK